MLKLGRVTKFKVLFVVLVFVFNFDLFKCSDAVLEKGLLFITFFFKALAFFNSLRSLSRLFHSLIDRTANVRPPSVSVSVWVKLFSE